MNATLLSEPLPNTAALADTVNSTAAWFVVTQVKANRVVYFTDDAAYQPPTEGDWYFVSYHVGPLPAEMTLRNCWGWRYNGVFSDVRKASKLSAPAALLQSNRQALRQLLADKVNMARESWRPGTALGTEIRQKKLEQARAYLAASDKATQKVDAFNLLGSVAAARNMALIDAARLVVAQDHSMWVALAQTETMRERYAAKIDQAQSLQELVELRRQLVDLVDVAYSVDSALPIVVMEPQDWTRTLSEVHRAHEIARLRAQLREIVNTRRAAVHGSYADDDTVLRHKARLAQRVLNNEAVDEDMKLLENFARMHRLSLQDGARLILGAMSEVQQVLTSTEIAKDRLLAEIEAIENLRDVQRTGAALDALSQSL